MSYTADSKTDSAIAQREIELLRSGRSYTEIVATLGGRAKSVSERNRLIYKVDLRTAFVERIIREGLPCRLDVPDSFGYWFSGFFDGEGCLTVFSRPRKRSPSHIERRLGAKIALRDDDFDVLRRIKDNLVVGRLNRHARKTEGNPYCVFNVERIQDLAEVIVPLFEKYPLHSKKSREFVIWSRLVRLQYALTLGGYSRRTSASDEQNAEFEEGLKAIRKIRTYDLAGISSLVARSGTTRHPNSDAIDGC